MTHLIPSKARKQRNSSAEVRDYRPLARGPQAQNPGNHPILFYKISHTKHSALIPCRLPDCAPAHCSPSSPALGKRDRTKQPVTSTPAPLQTAAGTGKPDLPPPSDKYRVSSSRHPCPATSRNDTKKGRDVPPLSGLQSLPPSGDGRDLTTKKRFTAPQGSGPAQPVR